MSGGVAPWAVLGSEISFADRWLRVRSDCCLTAEGDVIMPFHVIECPDWVTIVPLTRHASRLLVVREYRHGVGRVLTGLPGCLVDPSDRSDGRTAALASASRVLREETGFDGGTLEPLAVLHPNPSNQANTAYCFLATGLVHATMPQPNGPGEIQEVAEVEFKQVLDELRKGRLMFHAIHAAALWFAAARIATDRTNHFGPLTAQLQRMFTGEDPQFPSMAATQTSVAASTVRG